MPTVQLILQVLLVLIALLMTFFILLQEGKGGGLAALGGTSAAGVEGVTNPIRRATAYLAGIFLVLAVVIGFLGRAKSNGIKDRLSKTPVGAATHDLGKKKAGSDGGSAGAAGIAPKTVEPTKTESGKPTAPATKTGKTKPAEKKESGTATGKAEPKEKEAAPAGAAPQKTAPQKTAPKELDTKRAGAAAGKAGKQPAATVP